MDVWIVPNPYTGFTEGTQTELNFTTGCVTHIHRDGSRSPSDYNVYQWVVRLSGLGIIIPDEDLRVDVGL